MRCISARDSPLGFAQRASHTKLDALLHLRSGRTLGTKAPLACRVSLGLASGANAPSLFSDCARTMRLCWLGAEVPAMPNMIAPVAPVATMRAGIMRAIWPLIVKAAQSQTKAAESKGNQKEVPRMAYCKERAARDAERRIRMARNEQAGLRARSVVVV